MKTKLFLRIAILMICYSNIASSQSWFKKLPANKPKSELTFFDYKTAFYEYWEPFNVNNGFYFENGQKKKAAGWKQFKRWEYYMEGRINPTTGKFPQKTAQEVYEEYLISNPELPSVRSTDWINLGTNSSDGGYSGVGRISCIAFHPTDVNTYWIGAAAGGLWVTTDNGSSWTCLTDNNQVLAVSDIAIPSDYSTSNTIYIATGDKDGWDNNSAGVLKSTNGGTTWNTTGISFAPADWGMVKRLLIDPANNQIIIAATSNGVFKTTNGGTTWNTQLTGNNFCDLEYKPGDFNTLYGSNQNGEIYVTTDGGTSWALAFTDSNAQRIELAVSVNQPAWVYGVACGSDNGFYAVYKSINSGSSFTGIFDNSTTNLLGWESNGSDAGGQGYYDLAIAVSPVDANNLFIGGVNTWGSVNGGTSWAIVSHWSGNGAPAVHADKHMLKYQNSATIFECNDGGVYTSNDNGLSWTDKTNGLVISQMYKLGVSETDSAETITGLQDNGTKLLSGGAWYDVKGGDGMECLIDYTDVNVQYGTYVNGQITRTMDHWVSDFTDIQPSAAGDGAWVTPYIIDPVSNQTIYAGYADIWKTTDRGNNWTSISTMNTSAKIRSMAIASSNNQVLYVADPTTIWKTADGGTSWSDITGTLPVSTGNITYIAVKNDDANTLWVTMSGYNTSTVFQSVDGGNSWTDISAGLPQLPVYTIVQNKQSTTDVQLFVGTELGIYFRNGSTSWVPYNAGLPNVRIGEIEIHYDANPQQSKLRAATYGRGLWESPVYFISAPMSYSSSTTTQNETSGLSPNQTNMKIIGVEIVTNGNLLPLDVTSFTFNTTGSTSPLTDITNAKLFYTGSNNTFATATQFGTTSIAPSGTFNISGTQSLNSGTNYFWLTYDIFSTATIGNVVDAQCSSLTVGTALTPIVTDPLGSREIGNMGYCVAGASVTTYDEYISNVTFGTVNNSSLCPAGAYTDYPSLSTNIEQGASMVIDVTNGNPTYPADQCGIWVDWNNNGDFLDDPAINITGTPGGGPYSATLLCPPSTSTGLKRIRVRIHYNDETTDPCGISAWGEVEDYRINVTATSTGINEINNATDFKVFPSPATDIITLTVNRQLIGKDYYITDEFGKIVLSGKLLSEKSIVHINELASGIYIIRVMNQSKKMIK